MIPTPIFRIPYVLHYYFSLKKSQWLTISEIEKIQRRKLKGILEHAYQNVKFYHQKFDSAGIKPDNIKTIEDLSKIPVSHKQEIQESFPNEIVANNVNISKCHSGTTSGSTGIPLTVLQDSKAAAMINARDLRCFLEWGIKFGSKYVKIVNPRRSTKPSLFEQIGLRRKLISLFGDVNNHFSVLSDFRPDVISSYPSYIWLLAKKAQEMETKQIRPKLVFVSAELLADEARKTINTVFETETVDVYGSSEFGSFAWECPKHEGYHVDSESILVEVLRDGERVAPGEKGEIYCTGLDNYAMPFIRYNLQDIVIPTDESCSCGRGLPLIKVVEGKSSDVISLPSGRLVSPIAVIAWMREANEKIRCITRWRVTQEKKDVFSVEIVAKKTKDCETVCRRVEQELTEAFGENVLVRCKTVKSLSRDKSGKLRSVISKVRF